MKKEVLIIGMMLVITVASTGLANGPPLPMSLMGMVTYNGNPVPDGTIVVIYHMGYDFYDNGTVNNGLVGCNYLHTISANFGDNVRISCTYAGVTETVETTLDANPTWVDLTLTSGESPFVAIRTITLNGNEVLVDIDLAFNSIVYAPIITETYPDWAFQQVDTNDSYPKNSLQWLWTLKLFDGIQRHVTYKLTVPDDTSGEYYFDGYVAVYGGLVIQITGDTTIVIDWNPYDNDGVITDDEMQEITYKYQEQIPVNGHIVTQAELEQMTLLWQS